MTVELVFKGVKTCARLRSKALDMSNVTEKVPPDSALWSYAFPSNLHLLLADLHRALELQFELNKIYYFIQFFFTRKSGEIRGYGKERQLALFQPERKGPHNEQYYSSAFLCLVISPSFQCVFNVCIRVFCIKKNLKAGKSFV